MATDYNACVDLLDRNVDAGRGDHPAVVTRQRTVTYAELLDEVAATAAGLRRLGVVPEQRVAMVMLDSIEFYDVFLAAMRIGAVPAPVNPLLPGRDLGAIVATSRATVLVVSAERAGELDAIRAAAPEVSAVVVTGSPEWDALVGGGTDGGAPWSTWDESPGFWLCTSGSTGRPKLAMHRHLDLRVTADTYGAQVLGIGADDRCYSVGPMFHAYGLGNSLTFPFSVGATAVVEPTRPPTPGSGRRDRQLAPADVAVLHPDVLRRPVRVGPAGRHVRLGPLGRLGRRAAAGRDVSPLRRALRRAHPRWHRVHRDDAHLHLQQPDGPASGNVGTAGTGVPRRDRRRRRRTGSGGRAGPSQGGRRLDGGRLLVRQRRHAVQLRRRAHAHRRHVLVLRRTATTPTSVAATT